MAAHFEVEKQFLNNHQGLALFLLNLKQVERWNLIEFYLTAKVFWHFLEHLDICNMSNGLYSAKSQ